MLIFIIISDMFFTVTLIWNSINKNKWRSWRCLKILDLGWRWFLARITSTICAGRIILALCWQHSGKLQWQSIKLVLLTMHSCNMPPKRRLQTNTFHISMTRFWWQGQRTMYHGQDFMNHIVFWSMSLSILTNVSMFRSLKEEEDFVDVTLSCEESQYQAHKVVLSACSPYFRKLLKVIKLHICYTFTVLLSLARVQLQNYYLFRFYDLILFTSSPTVSIVIT